MPSGRHISAGAKSDDIVYPGAIFVPPIPAESVMGDSGHRTQAREGAPEPITSA